ncbi:MAG: hypothetical protein CM15mP65_25760 [Crocinitomicaceae bacterium]|nr:MAG: hypothetical protein CM15mP65_25760 [Crocinitomicaceae bacterium]
MKSTYKTVPLFTVPTKKVLPILESSTIGHNAIVHGCTIKDRVLIGMGAIVLDDCIIESDSIIAAGAVVTIGTQVKSGEIYAGVPAKKVKEGDFKYQLLDLANKYVAYSSGLKKLT